MYRFSEIIGQKEAVGHFQNALRTGHISHAYIISGDEGSGKMDLARTFATALQCENRTETNGLLEACGTCHSCIQAGALDQPDIITVVHQKKSDTDRGAISVDDIRTMRGDVQIKPYASAYKVYIVPNAEKMTVQAQNALLKTLEEPPAYAVILLLARGVQNFLPTVMSRCVTLRLHPVPDKVLSDHLVQTLGVSADKALQSARLSHGNPGRARALLTDETLMETVDKTLAFLERFPGIGSYEIAEFSAAMGDKKTNRTDDCLDIARSFTRDLLVLKSTDNAENLIFQEKVQYIKKVADALSLHGIAAMDQAFDQALRRRSANGNDVQILEMLFLSMRSAFAGE